MRPGVDDLFRIITYIMRQKDIVEETQKQHVKKRFTEKIN